MAHITLVTGGCRSGKSAFAQHLAESLTGSRLFLATCPVEDEEMRQRVERHRQARSTGQWQTLEEPLDVQKALAGASLNTIVLVDCLTLWVSNLMYRAEQDGSTLQEDEMAHFCKEVLDAAKRHSGNIIFVTNEVGLGIVPENAVARRFRDLVGCCNQCIAATADTVTLVACGIPLQLKGTK